MLTEVPISYDKIVRSPVFRFLIGKQQTPMTIHTALVAEQSPALRSLVSGFMEEAQTRTVIWEDVEEETFALFAQFVYTGDYPPPPCTLVDKSPVPSTGNDGGLAALAGAVFLEESSEESGMVDTTWNAAPAEDPWDIDMPVAAPASFPQQNNFHYAAEPPEAPRFVPPPFPEPTSKKKKGRRNKFVVERTKFHDLVYSPPASFSSAETCQPRPNKTTAEDYSPVFLGHARLYVLAEKYGIKNLKTLVLHKLHSTLCQFTPYKVRYGDVVELVRYTYDNTPSRKRMDELRELVTQYVAYEAKQIAGCRQCLSLVEDCGQFARDLLSMVLERVK